MKKKDFLCKRTLTTAFPIPGIDPIVKITNFTYTVNAEGRLATSVETDETHTTNYTFIWEEL